MRLRVLTAGEAIVDEDVAKVIAEAENGSFCLLPRHVDFVAALVPGIVVFETGEGAERFVAVDEGILTKCGPEVCIATRNAVVGSDLASLRRTVENELLQLDDHDRSARSALARLEAGAIRKFLQLREQQP